MRLARFNVSDKAKEPTADRAYFIGVPAPAGAFLVMLPMFVSFAFADVSLLPGYVIAVYMIGIGLLMISRIPTWSFKKTRVSRHNVKFFLVGFAVATAALLIEPWVSLVMVCLAYIGMVIWALLDRRTF
jgi:CDP-diacylglycerol--serine O-phosphatidyltransferase